MTLFRRYLLDHVVNALLAADIRLNGRYTAFAAAVCKVAYDLV